MNTQISSPKEGGIIHLHSYFSIGPRPSPVQKGGGGMCLKYPPRSTYVVVSLARLLADDLRAISASWSNGLASKSIFLDSHQTEANFVVMSAISLWG